ncbi:unnamed protein product [Clavelina lepadiformis]|uniref:C2H2-type domain-containing protein n=1 Tax=Clavelina lepadiformis TaxID=159417 RepID=A0ABP0FRG6_CLALP
MDPIFFLPRPFYKAGDDLRRFLYLFHSYCRLTKLSDEGKKPFFLASIQEMFLLRLSHLPVAEMSLEDLIYQFELIVDYPEALYRMRKSFFNRRQLQDESACDFVKTINTLGQQDDSNADKEYSHAYISDAKLNEAEESLFNSQQSKDLLVGRDPRKVNVDTRHTRFTLSTNTCWSSRIFRDSPSKQTKRKPGLTANSESSFSPFNLTQTGCSSLEISFCGQEMNTNLKPGSVSQTHDGNRFFCKLCDKIYKRKDYYRVHYRNKHAGNQLGIENAFVKTDGDQAPEPTSRSTENPEASDERNKISRNDLIEMERKMGKCKRCHSELGFMDDENYSQYEKTHQCERNLPALTASLLACFALLTFNSFFSHKNIHLTLKPKRNCRQPSPSRAQYYTKQIPRDEGINVEHACTNTNPEVPRPQKLRSEIVVVDGDTIPEDFPEDYRDNDKRSKSECRSDSYCGPQNIRDRTEFDRFLIDIQRKNIRQWSDRLKSESAWVVEFVCNVEFYINPLWYIPIGVPIALLEFIISNKGSCYLHLGRHGSFRDNLCFLRHVALYRQKLRGIAKRRIDINPSKVKLQTQDEHQRLPTG